VDTPRDRNRAFNGDIVVIKPMEQDRGRVVQILQKTSRTGFLQGALRPGNGGPIFIPMNRSDPIFMPSSIAPELLDPSATNPKCRLDLGTLVWTEYDLHPKGAVSSQLSGYSALKSPAKQENDGVHKPGKPDTVSVKDRAPAGRGPAKRPFFKKYMSLPVARAGVRGGIFFEGKIRINQKNPMEAYTSLPAFKVDVLFDGKNVRNRALDGDQVIFQLLPMKSWPLLVGERPGSSQEGKRPLGEVVQVTRADPNAEYSGVLAWNGQELQEQLKTDSPKGTFFSNETWVIFNPTSARVPFLRIMRADLSQVVTDLGRTGCAGQLFMAKIVSWDEEHQLPIGTVTRHLGPIAAVEPETEALLLQNKVDFSEFSQPVLDCLSPTPWTISEAEIKVRRDFRAHRVFSIDPTTARDLDDALSCVLLPSGNYEIGVHIADVSYFVTPGTALDAVAQERATTVYVVQKAIPMLPRLLCEELCSLNAGQDRCAFSVVFTMTPEAVILDRWFGRTVIRSCAKMSYDHAQDIIDGNADAVLPKIHDGHSVEEVKQDVLALYRLSLHLRRGRFEHGVLSLKQPKLFFRLGEDGLPQTCGVYPLKESNRLIEEFMLLANMAVAEKIHQSFPGEALLRRHPHPLDQGMYTVIETARRVGITLDDSTALALQHSLDAVTDPLKNAVMQHLCIKPMQPALYFSSGTMEETGDFDHYALGVKFYTHFTSPIRRYADVVVHRELLAACQQDLRGPGCYDKVLVAPTAEVSRISDTCNLKKKLAKVAQDGSARLFLCLYIQRFGVMATEGVICECRESSFVMVIPEFGFEKMVKYTDLEGIYDPSAVLGVERPDGAALARITWASTEVWSLCATRPLVDVDPVISLPAGGLGMYAMRPVVDIRTMEPVKLRGEPRHKTTELRIFDRISVRLEADVSRSPVDVLITIVGPAGPKRA